MIALIIAIILWLGGIADLENQNPGLIEDYKIEYAAPQAPIEHEIVVTDLEGM